MSYHTHIIQGTWTTKNIDFLLHPENTLIIASDICAAGQWENSEFDNHTELCVSNFIDIVNKNPIIIKCLQKNSMILINEFDNQNPTLMNFLKNINANYTVMNKTSFNIGQRQYHPYRHIIIWGIHRELCVAQLAVSTANLSNFTRSIILNDACVPLTPGANIDQLARFIHNIDIVYGHNINFISYHEE